MKAILKKRVLALMLCISMAISIMQISAYAASGDDYTLVTNKTTIDLDTMNQLVGRDYYVYRITVSQDFYGNKTFAYIGGNNNETFAPEWGRQYTVEGGIKGSATTVYEWKWSGRVTFKQGYDVTVKIEGLTNTDGVFVGIDGVQYGHDNTKTVEVNGEYKITPQTIEKYNYSVSVIKEKYNGSEFTAETLSSGNNTSITWTADTEIPGWFFPIYTIKVVYTDSRAETTLEASETPLTLSGSDTNIINSLSQKIKLKSGDTELTGKTIYFKTTDGNDLTSDFMFEKADGDEFSVCAYFDGDETYRPVTAELPVKVTAAFQVNDINKDFTGNPITVDLNETGRSSGEVIYYDNNKQPISAPTNPGDYYYRVKDGSKYSNYGSLRINEIAPTVNYPILKENLVYNGAEQDLITAGSSEHGTWMYTDVVVFGTPTFYWPEKFPKAKDAGTYTWWYVFWGETGYSDIGPFAIDVTISPKPVTVDLASSNIIKTYDGTATLENVEVVLSGIEPGDTVTATATITYDNKNAGTDKAITASNIVLSGESAKNYTADGVSATGTGVIVPCPVTVKANDASKIYGEADPALDFTVSSEQFKSSLVGELARTQGENVGVYAITQGTLTNDNNPNFDITFISGKFIIEHDKSGIEGITIDTVKSTDKENIEYVYNQLENAAKDLADEDKISEWNTLQAYCAAMRQRIESVENQIEAFENKLGEYDIDTVTSDDNDDLVNLFDSVYSFTVEYNDNLTDDEKDKCGEISAAIADLTRRIGAVGEEITCITDAVNGYDKATVKSSDKADLEQLIADINALTTGNNITDSERANLLALADTVNELLAVIGDTTDEISRIVNAVNAYDVNTVTGDDVKDLLGLIDDVNALLETDNLTTEETEVLNQAVKDVQRLISIYDTVSAQLGDIKERMNRYDEATVKSSDKADIEQLKADIKELTDGQNLTAAEREYLVNADAECDKLLAKIAETKSEYDRVIAAANGYDKATVTSADRDALVKLRIDAYSLSDTDNVTPEEKENLLNAFEKLTEMVETLINVGNEIERIISAVGGYDEATVKYSDYKDILQLIDDIEALTDGQNISEDERANLEELNTKANLLAAKIRSTVDEIARITRAVNTYNIDTVKSSDKAAVENLIERIKKLTDGDNITDAEREQLVANDETLDALLAKINATADEIARIEEAVNSYDVATVKSTDKADLGKLIEDIKALTDATNITEEERTKLGELDTTVDSLIKKIDDTAAEIARIDEAVNAYDEETVKSSDEEAIEQLKEDIKALTDGDNITEEERAALAGNKAGAYALTDKIADTKAEIDRIDEAVNAYDEDTVKSTDKEAIEQLKEDIHSLIDSGNITENEKTALGEMIKDIEALEGKIEETEEQLEEIKGIENNYNPENVSSDDKAAIKEIIAEIEAVNPDNLTDEQKAEYDEIKTEFEKLLDRISAATAQVDAVGKILEAFDEERVTIFWEDEIEALKAKIDELLADVNMGEAEKAKLNEYKAQCDKLIVIIHTPVEYFSLRLFYFIWDCLTWKYNGILWLFSKIFGFGLNTAIA